MKEKGTLVSERVEVDKTVSLFEFENDAPYMVGDIYDHNGALHVVTDVWDLEIEAVRFKAIAPNPLISSQP